MEIIIWTILVSLVGISAYSESDYSQYAKTKLDSNPISGTPNYHSGFMVNPIHPSPNNIITTLSTKGLLSNINALNAFSMLNNPAILAYLSGFGDGRAIPIVPSNLMQEIKRVGGDNHESSQSVAEKKSINRIENVRKEVLKNGNTLVVTDSNDSGALAAAEAPVNLANTDQNNGNAMMMNRNNNNDLDSFFMLLNDQNIVTSDRNNANVPNSNIRPNFQPSPTQSKNQEIPKSKSSKMKSFDDLNENDYATMASSGSGSAASSMGSGFGTGRNRPNDADYDHVFKLVASFVLENGLFDKLSLVSRAIESIAERNGQQARPNIRKLKYGETQFSNRNLNRFLEQPKTQQYFSINDDVTFFAPQLSGAIGSEEISSAKIQVMLQEPPPADSSVNATQ